ncbi:MAG: sulfur carrier protein ThiS [Phycisphaerales bacterium]|nr:sulfur carrier protein ThiS [Phycisphaerales bacterium]
MKCVVNGQERELEDGVSVEGLIELMGMGDAVCAVEVEKKLVPKRERASCVLCDGPRVEIVTLIGGG